MRTTALLILAVFVFSCSSDSGPPDPAPNPGPGPGATTEEIGRLPQSTKLAGRELVEAKEGPWTVRRVASAPEGRNDARKEALALGRGGARAPGAAVPATAGPADGGGMEPPTAPLADSADDAPAEGSGGGPSGGELSFGAEEESAPMPEDSMGGDEDMERARPDRNGGAPLRAGSTDDNEEFDAFLDFLAKWSDRGDTAGRYDLLDVRDRRHVRVVNEAGRPVPGAVVRVVDPNADRIVFTGTTYGDGRVPFYPKVALAEGTVVPVSGDAAGLVVEVAAGDVRRRVSWDLAGPELEVKVDVAEPVSDPIRLDVLFLIDTTGSMGDEIARIKGSLLSVTQKLRALDREFDLRYGAVLYRDLGDEYVTSAHPFTSDIRAFDEALASVDANGGGDTPESLNQGLAEAVGRADWRPDAAKVMFLIADAPPHMDYQGDVRYGETVKAAVAKGIRIHSVAASGLDPLGTFIFRQIAQFTRGRFIFIEYGTVRATAESHGVTGAVKSNNLDDILFVEIRDEIARWGR